MRIDRATLAADLVRAAGLDALDVAAIAAEPATLSLAGSPARVVAIGWATVDLDRAWVELSTADPADGPPFDDGSVRESARDDLLGARSRWLADEVAGPGLILLEPDTEGRLAAGLVRRGEGPIALYVALVGLELSDAVDRLGSGGVRVRTGQTALGPGAIVLGRSVAGPQVLLVAVPSQP